MKVDLRKPTEEDIERFRQCLAVDPDHHGQDPDAWLTGPSEFWVFYDESGYRVWVRMEKVLKVSLQHEQAAPKKSTVSILYKGFSWLQSSARKNGFSEVIFESRAPRLILFLQKLFGFKPVSDSYNVRTIGPTVEIGQRTI